MIIKKLEITSFGKFSNKVIEFSDGFNVVSGNNESGKTTIINFIYSMLYGFGDNRGKTLSLREKYTPWDGGVCEGKMTIFTDSGKNICIYRKAGSAKKYDTLHVYDADTGEDYPESPEEIIGIGQDTFLKTLCIRQLLSTFEGNNDEIIQKLSNIASGGDETVSYEKAQKILESTRREIQPQRGQGGQLSVIANKISHIEKEQLIKNRIKTEISSIDALFPNTEKEVMRLKKKADILKEKDFTSMIAHLQGRLVEAQKHSTSKSSIIFFTTGILCLAAATAFLLLSASYSLMLFTVSLILIIAGFIKKHDSVKNNVKDIEEEIKKLTVQNESFDKEKESVNRALSEAEKKLEDLKIRKQSLTMSLNEDDASLEDLIKAKKQLESKLHIVTVSMEALKRAHENMQKNFTPVLNKKATEYFSNICDGKYSRIFCDKEFGVMVEKDLPRESSFFSGGTVDQLYLSVRLALVDMLYNDSSCPIILDQPFLQYDKLRKERTVSLLENLPQSRQILLFTSDESINSTNKATEMLT